jgi:hypothetical protein
MIEVKAFVDITKGGEASGERFIPDITSKAPLTRSRILHESLGHGRLTLYPAMWFY